MNHLKITFPQELFFFIGIFFFLVCVYPLCTKFDNYRYLPIILPVFLTTIIFTWYKFGVKNSCQTDSFDFEVTPAKKCQGFPYMQQSGPEHDFCQNLLSTPSGVTAYEDVNCGRGYAGRPLPYFEYTPESNDKWESERCTQGPTPLQVL